VTNQSLESRSILVQLQFQPLVALIVSAGVLADIGAITVKISASTLEH
jgi:hypothetical protein